MDIVSHVVRTNRLDHLAFDIDIAPVEWQVSGSMAALRKILADPILANIRDIRFCVPSRGDADVSWRYFRSLVREAGLDPKMIFTPEI
jgi:hypothetical protein